MRDNGGTEIPAGISMKEEEVQEIMKVEIRVVSICQEKFFKTRLR